MMAIKFDDPLMCPALPNLTINRSHIRHGTCFPPAMISFSRFKSCLVLATAYFMLACTGWLIGNHLAIVSLYPERAAIKIAQKYEAAPTGAYSAELVTDGVDQQRVYTVFRDNQRIAQVAISAFIGLGWQEDSYLRL